MADTISVTCPTCKKNLKVPGPYAGKRVKCVGCGQTISVPAAQAPSATPKSASSAPTASGAKPSDANASNTMPGQGPKVTWDDELDNDNKPMAVIKEDETPRCPHCAQVLVPPDAIVCIHCGFNNRTRTKAETKKVYEPDASEWFAHLAPGVLAVVALVTLLVLDVACLMNMRYWMEDGLLQMDEEGFDGRKKFYVAPGCFITVAFLATIMVGVSLVRFAYRRLFKEYMPPEVAMK